MKDEEPLEPDPVIEFYKKDIDRTLIRENLKLTVEERFRKMMAFARFAREMRPPAAKPAHGSNEGVHSTIAAAFQTQRGSETLILTRFEKAFQFGKRQDVLLSSGRSFCPDKGGQVQG